jgi:hypothetical protein
MRSAWHSVRAAASRDLSKEVVDCASNGIASHETGPTNSNAPHKRVTGIDRRDETGVTVLFAIFADQKGFYVRRDGVHPRISIGKGAPRLKRQRRFGGAGRTRIKAIVRPTPLLRMKNATSTGISSALHGVSVAVGRPLAERPQRIQHRGRVVLLDEPGPALVHVHTTRQTGIEAADRPHDVDAFELLATALFEDWLPLNGLTIQIARRSFRVRSR